MRIAIDGRELAGQITGVGRYLHRLLTSWNEIDAAQVHEYLLCAHAPMQVPSLPNLRVTTALRAGTGRTTWEQFALPGLVRQLAPDVFFAPAYTAPVVGRTPLVLTIHDVSFCAHPEWFSWREGTRRRAVTSLAAKRASRVLTLSRFSKSEILRHLGVPGGRVQVIPLGTSGLPRVTDVAREPLVLFVGSLLPRRHVPALVSGFARLAERIPTLTMAIVGAAPGRAREDLQAHIDRSGVAARISVTGFVSDEALARLYARASAFAFPSSYEGFGLTPLDAIAAGVPPLVLDTAVARETYGAAAHYVAQPDPSSLAAGLERVLFDNAARAGLTAAAPLVLSRYNWATTARETLDALAAVARRR